VVAEFGPDLGKPKFYETVVEGFAIPRMKIHYTGCDLPFWQKITENLYGMSVLERLYDRLVVFDDQGPAVWTFGEDSTQDIVLKGTAQGACVNFPAAFTSAGAIVNVDVTWTEQ
jgi:hypothetical protein